LRERPKGSVVARLAKILAKDDWISSAEIHDVVSSKYLGRRVPVVGEADPLETGEPLRQEPQLR
jgi:hypothetical protein